MRVLITGASGFLGYYLVKELYEKSTIELVIAHREGSSLHQLSPFDDRLEYHELDIMAIHPLVEIMDTCDAVIHAAAHIGTASSDKDLLEESNVQLTRNIVDICLSGDIKKVIHISSTSALGKAFDNKALDEKTDWEPSEFNSDYGNSKYLAELEVFRGISEGLNATILSPSQMIGMGDTSKGSPALIRRIYQGLTKLPTGSNGFVDVRDVAKMVHYILCNETQYDKYICSAENLFYHEVVAQFCQLFDKEPPNKWVHKRHISVLKIAEKLGLISSNTALSSQRLITGQRQMQFDNQRSVTDLAFTYRSIQSTIEESAKCYLAMEKAGKDQLYLH